MLGGVNMSTVQKWGNSLAVRIPAVLAGQLELGDGAEVEVSIRNGELVVRPIRTQKLSLRDLLKNCKPSQLHGETDFGEDVGREVLE
jgi:antitoxin MazE